MQGPFQQSEAVASRRLFRFFLVDADDGKTPENGEAGGQPQVDKNGAGWVNTTATLVEVSGGPAGAYTVTLTSAELNTLGTIQVRYKSANTCEFQDLAQVVAQDPFAAVDLSGIPAAVWAYGARTLTSYGTLVADIGVEVWAYGTRTLTSISALTASVSQAVWEYATRTLTAWLGGAKSVTLQVRDGSAAAVPNCPVRVVNPSSATVLEETTHSSTGNVTVNLDEANNYSVFLGPLAGYTFSNPYDLDVSAAATQTVTLTCAAASSSPANGMTYSQLQAAVDLHLDRKYSDGARFIPRPLRQLWVNQAYQKIDLALRWSRSTYSFVTTATQPEYTLPGTVREVMAVTYTRDTTVYKLTELALDEYITKLADNSAAGRPDYYMRHGNTFTLYPTPDAASDTIELYMVTEPADLSADGDKPGWPVYMHGLIVDLVLGYAAAFMGDVAAATAQREHVELELNRAAAKPAATNRGEPSRFINLGV